MTRRPEVLTCNCRQIHLTAIFGSLALFISILLTTAPAFSQVPDPMNVDPSDPGNSAPSETREPVQTPNLSNTNQNADTVQYEDRELGPFNIGFDLKSGFSDNLFNSPSGTTQSGAFAGFGVPVGVRLRSPRTLFDANYRIDKDYYPRFSQVNNTSQTYTHQLEHHASERTSYFWNLAAGQLTSIGQYLPSLINIGNTGVSSPSIGASVAQNSYLNYNAVTSLGFAHRVSERDELLGTATGGWIEQAQAQAAVGTQRQVLRSDLGGLDLRYQRSVTPQAKLGVEFTNVYIRGLSPYGHDNYTTVEGTYRLGLTNHLDLSLAAGPLYNTSSDVGNPGHQSQFTYSASGALGYTVAHSRMEVSFARVIQVQYVSAPLTAYQVSALFDRELSPTIDLTLDTRYISTDSGASPLSDSQLGFTGRINKRIGSNVLLFVSVSRSQQTSPLIFNTNTSFNRDDVFGGVTLLLGNPIYRTGAH